MKTFRKTAKWVFLLLVIGAGAAGAYAFYFWNHSDELLRQTLLERLHELAPDWDVNFPRARFDLRGRIHIHDLCLKGVDGRPLLEVPEVVLVVDREQLMEPHPPMRLVRLVAPRLHLDRDASGVWNFQKLPPPNPPRNVIPEMHLERMTLAVSFHDDQQPAVGPTLIENVQVALVPAGARQWLVKAAAKFPHSDGMTAEGHWQIDAGKWELGGAVKNLALGGTLSKLAAGFSPEYRGGLAAFETRLNRLAARAAEAAPPAASSATPSAAPGGGPAADLFDRLGLTASADVQFRFSQWRPAAEREYAVSIHILQGELKNPPGAFPLRELRGEIEFDNQQVRLRDFSAHSGLAHLRLDRGRISERGDRRPADFDFSISSLPLDARLAGLLPASIRKVYDDLQLTGEADVRTHLEFDGTDRWEHACDLTVRHCTAAHVRFPYRIEQVEGTLTQRGGIVDVAMQGYAGSERVSLSGRVKNPGPEAACLLVVKTAGIPIDERLRTACPQRFQTVIDELQAGGELAGEIQLVRPAGLEQPLSIIVDGRLKQGSINCRHFLYPLADVSGEFHGSGNTWRFENCRGRHGTAEVGLAGTLRPGANERSQIELNFSIAGATFDRQLFVALPEPVQAVWSEFNPDGGFDAEGQVLWSPGSGRPVRVTRLGARLFDAKLTLKSFPFTLTDLAAQIEYDGETAKIKGLSARHEESTIQVESGFARLEGDGEWRVRLEKLFVDDLEATPEFRRSLPKKLWTIVDALNPRGKQSISGMLEFRGKRGGEYPVTAAWDTVTVYTGTTINAGVDLCDIHGKAYFSGTWDGEQSVGEGRLDIKSARIFKYQVTDIKGPARMDGERLVFGSPPSPGRRESEAVDPARRLSAKFIEGRLALDAEVKLGAPMRYEVWLTLVNGELRRFAQLYMPNSNSRLDGVMNGSVDLTGEGTNPKLLTGAGKLVIKPAALYEFPVIVQVLNVLRLVPSGRKAFDQARFVFDIKGGVVHFERIDLEGNSLTLVGRGTVTFDGGIRLGFLSRTGRLQWPIPIVREAINEMTKGWIGVDVQGTLKDPKTRVQALPQMEEALRRLQESFDVRGPQRR